MIANLRRIVVARMDAFIAEDGGCQPGLQFYRSFVMDYLDDRLREFPKDVHDSLFSCENRERLGMLLEQAGRAPSLSALHLIVDEAIRTVKELAEQIRRQMAAPHWEVREIRQAELQIWCGMLMARLRNVFGDLPESLTSAIRISEDLDRLQAAFRQVDTFTSLDHLQF